MANPNFYQVLGVSRQATRSDVKQAYRRKALQHHPDKNPHGEDQFKVVTQAYHTLVDETRRAVYDARLFDAAATVMAAHQSPRSAAGSPRSEVNVDDLMRRDNEFNAKMGAKDGLTDWLRSKQASWKAEEHEYEQRVEELQRKTQTEQEEMDEQRKRFEDLRAQLAEEKEQEAVRREMDRERQEAERKAADAARMQRLLDAMEEEEERYKESKQSLEDQLRDWEKDNQREEQWRQQRRREEATRQLALQQRHMELTARLEEADTEHHNRHNDLLQQMTTQSAV